MTTAGQMRCCVPNALDQSYRVTDAAVELARRNRARLILYDHSTELAAGRL
jgi:hypothetical protein